ncbi:hypothetical protein [Paenibacillus sp.]|uniref:hypothetical protein n=1 Tax=Paenibacillus sp. TaxID=58172 RepID=UPI002810B160|nr:hypothetical protein [Paenibacillus sp.]
MYDRGSERSRSVAPKEGGSVTQGKLESPFVPTNGHRRMPHTPDVLQLQRTIGNKAFGRLLKSGLGRISRSDGGATAIQRKPLRWDQFELTSDEKADWKSHKTQGETKDLTMEQVKNEETLPQFMSWGYGAKVEGTVQGMDSWKTSITPKSKYKFGSKGLEAKKLGPDHPYGTQAKTSDHDEIAKKLQTIAEKARSGKLAADENYQAVTILSPNLGGDGSKITHVLLLPPTAANQVRATYQNIEKLVNNAMSWMYFAGDVTYEQDKRTPYAKKIVIQYWELDEKGVEVGGTKQYYEIEVPSPSKYGQTKAAAQSKTPNNLPAGNVPNKAADPNNGARRDDKTSTGWATRLTFGPTEPSTGDGTFMEANPLGPDHKIGEEPLNGKNHVWNRRTKELAEIAKAGQKHPYVAGHLLNHHLGGPGNDARNLAPIPIDANGEHEREVESFIKEMVNVNKAWMYYRVDVVEGNDGSVKYPKELTCVWYQIGVDGNAVPGTKGAKTISIKKPTEYNSTESSVKDNSSESNAKSPQAGARTKFAYNEVLLDDVVSLRHQRRVMASFVAKLDRLGLNHHFHNEDLSQHVELILAKFKPTQAETEALHRIGEIGAEIESVGTSLQKMEALLPGLKKDLLESITTAQIEIDNRHNESLKAAKEFLDTRYSETLAKELHSALETAQKNDKQAFERTDKLAGDLLRLIGSAIGKAKEHHGQLIDAANQVREWIGKDRIDPEDDVENLDNEILTSFKEGAKNMVDIFKRPGSPGQMTGFAERLTGTKYDNADEAQVGILEYSANIERGHNAGVNYETIPPTNRLQEMEALLLEKGTNLPEWDKTTKNKVATRMKMIRKGFEPDAIPEVREEAKEMLEDAYRASINDFKEYLDWLKKK